MLHFCFLKVQDSWLHLNVTFFTTDPWLRVRVQATSAYKDLPKSFSQVSSLTSWHGGESHNLRKAFQPISLLFLPYPYPKIQKLRGEAIFRFPWLKKVAHFSINTVEWQNSFGESFISICQIMQRTLLKDWLFGTFQRSERIGQRRVKRGRDARGGHTQQRRPVQAIENQEVAVAVTGSAIALFWTISSSSPDDNVPAAGAKTQSVILGRGTKSETVTKRGQRLLWNCSDC